MEAGREGGREGRREGRREGGREGGRAFVLSSPWPPFFLTHSSFPPSLTHFPPSLPFSLPPPFPPPLHPSLLLFLLLLPPFLQVSEWRHRSSDIFSFRSKWVTIDFWDFSGDPDYHTIYSCFPCSKSLHLVVCNSQNLNHNDLIRWLADIQSTSVERIPVIVVFTHMDEFSSREQKDVFRRRTLQWLQYQEKRFSMVSRSYSFGAARSQTIKNLS